MVCSVEKFCDAVREVEKGMFVCVCVCVCVSVCLSVCLSVRPFFLILRLAQIRIQQEILKDSA